MLELERIVTGLEWLVTGLETCVATRAGALAGACARTACDARVRTCTVFALDFATLRREMLDWAADVDPAPESVAGCTGERALSAKAVVGVGGVPTLFGSERATSVPTTTAADVVRTSTTRLRAAHRAAPLGAGRVSAEPRPPATSPRSCARRRAAWAPSRSPPAARMTASRRRRASVAGRVSESVRVLGAGPVPALLQERPQVEGAVLVAALVRAPVTRLRGAQVLRASRGGRQGSARRPRGRARRLRGTRARR